MTKPVRPNEFAEREILHELRWYEAENAGLGDRLWAEIQRVALVISDHPAIGEVVRGHSRQHPAVRRFPIEHFPFMLIYREHPEYIEIIALAPNRRKPNYWIGRVTRE